MLNSATYVLVVDLAHAPTNAAQQQIHSTPSVFPSKSAGAVSQSYAQNEALKDHPQGISILSLLVTCNMSYVIALGWLKN